MRSNSTLGAEGAYFELSGEQPNNSTWQENIYFMEAGSPMNLTGLIFEMTFRSHQGEANSCKTLSTADATLAIEADSVSGVSNILAINVAAGQLQNLCGDFISDLVSKDQNGVITPWAHGIVTFRPNPLTF